MGIGVFIDKQHRPTDDEICRVLGATLPLWEELVQLVRETYRAGDELKFMYGKTYGWALRFAVKSKLLTAFYPAEGAFRVQIVLSTAAVEAAQKLKLGKNAQAAIEDANPYPEGRWLFVYVTSQRDLADVRRLLALKVGSAKG